MAQKIISFSRDDAHDANVTAKVLSPSEENVSLGRVSWTSLHSWAGKANTKGPWTT